jgi:hypothetical protein
MVPKCRWHDPEGLRTITKIVKAQIPQWKDGLYPSQDNIITWSGTYSTAKLSYAVWQLVEESRPFLLFQSLYSEKWPGTVTSTQIFPFVRYHKELLSHQ